MSLKLYCVNTAFKASLGDFLGGGDNLINTWKSTIYSIKVSHTTISEFSARLLIFH